MVPSAPKTHSAQLPYSLHIQKEAVSMARRDERVNSRIVDQPKVLVGLIVGYSVQMNRMGMIVS